MTIHKLALAPTSLPDATPLDYINAAVTAGYDYVGLRLNPSPGFPFTPVVGDASLIRDMKSTLDGAGLKVLDVYSFYLVPDVDVAKFEGAIALAAEFGAKYLVTMGADTDWNRQRDNFIRICGIAAKYGLVCTVEPAVIRSLANVPQTERLLAEAGCKNVGIVVDPLNFIRAGETPAGLAHIDPKLLQYGQLTDGVIAPGEPNLALLGRMSPNRRTMLGAGDVPVGAVLDALPPGVPLSLELPPPDGSSYGAAEWAKIILDDARQFLAKHYATA